MVPPIRAIAAYALGNLGTVLIQQGRLAEAQAALEESTAALYAMRDTQSYFIHLFNLGTVRHERGDLLRAEQDYRQVIAAAERAGWNTVQGMALGALGVLRAACEEVVEAGRLFDAAEASSAPAGERRVAVVRVHRGHLELALARVGVPWEFVSDEYYFNWDVEAVEIVAAQIAGRFRVDT